MDFRRSINIAPNWVLIDKSHPPFSPVPPCLRERHSSLFLRVQSQGQLPVFDFGAGVEFFVEQTRLDVVIVLILATADAEIRV